MKRIRDAQTIIGMLEGGEVAAALGSEITETLADARDRTGLPTFEGKPEMPA